MYTELLIYHTVATTCLCACVSHNYRLSTLFV